MNKYIKILLANIFLLTFAGPAFALDLSSSGLDVGNNQVWYQDIPGIIEKSDVDDLFGRSVVTGDFNGDGIEDTAIGVPGESVGNITKAGGVNVIYGNSTGLSVTNNQFWSQNSPGILGIAEIGDYFGYSLSAGDFNGDGFDDLAIGVPFEDIGGSIYDAGAVNVIYGSSSGLTATGNQVWYQNNSGIKGKPYYTDMFGYSLSAGDFNGDGFNDLAIGVPHENVGSIVYAGVVQVIYGSSSGLDSTGNQMFNQSDAAGKVEYMDKFGFSVSHGDFNGDGKDDLAIGTPREDVGSIVDAGAVNILYGTDTGLSPNGSQQWYQNKSGIKGEYTSWTGQFGFSVSHGDFNGDGKDDLAIGVPNNVVGEEYWFAGSVNVIYGTNTGLSADNNQLWNRTIIAGDGAAYFDHFGFSLAVSDFNGDGSDDLAIGVPYEDVGSIVDAGAVNIIYGSPVNGSSNGGLVTNGSQEWYQGKSGILGKPEYKDYFGYAMAAGSLNGDGFDDLVIGVPYENVGNIANAGVVQVIYG